jgi:hypothetical protein
MYICIVGGGREEEKGVKWNEGKRVRWRGEERRGE